MILKKGRAYEIIKIYPNFYLCESDLGYKECFSKYEIDGVPRQIIYKQSQMYYINDKPYTIRQIMNMYGLTRSQVVYRINSGKALKDGRVIERIDM